MKKFVKAKLNDKLQDVWFLYGFEIDDNFPLNDKTKDYIFQLDNHKYFGSHLDYLGNMEHLLFYTYDKRTLVQNINVQLQMLGINKITLEEKIYLGWARQINDQKNVDNKCINCKYCSYNVMLDEYRKKNWFSRFIYYLTKGYLFEKEFKHPKCLNEKVYRKAKPPIDLVYGKDMFNSMFCSNARTDSYTNDRVEYNCCQSEGRYFQHK